MKEIIKEFLKNGYLLNPDLAKSLQNTDYKDFLSEINKEKYKPVLLNEDIKKILEDKKEFINISWQEFDKARVLYEKEKEKNIYQTFLDILNQNFKGTVKELQTEVNENKKNNDLVHDDIGEEGNLIILKDYNDIERKRDVETFTEYFRARYNTLKNILSNRPELQNAISINRLQNKTEHEKIVIIGLVNDKRMTKNGNLLITLEDPTGFINIVVTRNKFQIFNDANDILLDEVIGVRGLNGDKIVFADNIFFQTFQVITPLKNLVKKFMLFLPLICK